MDREYVDKELQRLATDGSYQPPDWSDDEVADFRLLDQCARAAQVGDDLRGMRLLRLQPYVDGGPQSALGKLGSSREVTLTFKGPQDRAVVVFELLTQETEAS